MEEDKKSDQVEISQSKSKILSKKNDSLQPKSHSILLSHKLYFVEKSSLIWSFLCEFGNKTTNLIYEIEIAGQRRILCTLCSGPKEVVEKANEFPSFKGWVWSILVDTDAIELLWIQYKHVNESHSNKAS